MCEVHDSQLKMVVKIDDLLTSLYITVTLPACLLRVTTVTISVHHVFFKTFLRQTRITRVQGNYMD